MHYLDYLVFLCYNMEVWNFFSPLMYNHSTSSQLYYKYLQIYKGYMLSMPSQQNNWTESEKYCLPEKRYIQHCSEISQPSYSKFFTALRCPGKIVEVSLTFNWVLAQICGQNLTKSAKFEPLLIRSFRSYIWWLSSQIIKSAYWY